MPIVGTSILASATDEHHRNELKIASFHIPRLCLRSPSDQRCRSEEIHLCLADLAVLRDSFPFHLVALTLGTIRSRRRSFRLLLSRALLAVVGLVGCRRLLWRLSCPLSRSGRGSGSRGGGAVLGRSFRRRSAVAGLQARGESAVFVFQLVLRDAHELPGGSWGLEACDGGEFVVVDLFSVLRQRAVL